MAESALIGKSRNLKEEIEPFDFFAEEMRPGLEAEFPLLEEAEIDIKLEELWLLLNEQEVQLRVPWAAAEGERRALARVRA